MGIIGIEIDDDFKDVASNEVLRTTGKGSNLILDVADYSRSHDAEMPDFISIPLESNFFSLIKTLNGVSVNPMTIHKYFNKAVVLREDGSSVYDEYELFNGEADLIVDEVGFKVRIPFSIYDEGEKNLGFVESKKMSYDLLRNLVIEQGETQDKLNLLGSSIYPEQERSLERTLRIALGTSANSIAAVVNDQVLILRGILGDMSEAFCPEKHRHALSYAAYVSENFNEVLDDEEAILCASLQTFQETEGLEPMSADDQLHELKGRPDTPEHQIRFLTNFIEAWDDLEHTIEVGLN